MHNNHKNSINNTSYKQLIIDEFKKIATKDLIKAMIGFILTAGLAAISFKIFVDKEAGIFIIGLQCTIPILILGIVILTFSIIIDKNRQRRNKNGETTII